MMSVVSSGGVLVYHARSGSTPMGAGLPQLGADASPRFSNDGTGLVDSETIFAKAHRCRKFERRCGSCIADYVISLKIVEELLIVSERHF